MNNHYYQIRSKNLTTNCLLVAPAVAAKWNLRHNAYKILRFGQRAKRVKIKVLRQIKRNTLHLSNNVITALKLPLSSLYQLTGNKDELILGPFIGLLAAIKSHTLKKRLNRLKYFVTDYEKIGGTIVVFALDQAMGAKGKISGYIYNPNTDEWEDGVFSYPTAVLVQTSLSSKKRYLLESRLKTTIINKNTYNKWQSYKLLSHLTKSVPDTYLYESPEQILHYLQKYKCVFVKPIKSSGGKRIRKIILTPNGTITVFSQKNGRKRKITFQTKQQASFYFTKVFTYQRWIIQQPIQLVTFANSVIDFRCIVVKDEHKVWKSMGVVAKYGTKGNIVSNIYSGGKAEMGADALKKVLHLSDEQAEKLCQDIGELSIQAVKSLENGGGTLSNAGVDIGIDQNLKLWVIEVNTNNPAHNIAIDANNPELYRQIVVTSMLYLKSRAGFD